MYKEFMVLRITMNLVGLQTMTHHQPLWWLRISIPSTKHYPPSKLVQVPLPALISRSQSSSRNCHQGTYNIDPDGLTLMSTDNIV